MLIKLALSGIGEADEGGIFVKRTGILNYVVIYFILDNISFRILTTLRHASLYTPSRLHLYVLFLDYQRRFKFA